jgi:hypothetical protein
LRNKRIMLRSMDVGEAWSSWNLPTNTVFRSTNTISNKMKADTKQNHTV